MLPVQKTRVEYMTYHVLFVLMICHFFQDVIHLKILNDHDILQEYFTVAIL